MPSPAAHHNAPASDPRKERWSALAQRVYSRRLTRVIAPAGYDKTAFADHIAQTTTQAVTRLTFSYTHHSLRSALQHLCKTLNLSEDAMELPNLLAIGGRVPPAALARALASDMSHPALTGRVLILDNVHLLERETANVLVQMACADPLRCHLLVCVRHPAEFPARELWGVPTLDLTERELAYTQAELRDLAGSNHDDPFGYPALAHAAVRGIRPELHMRRILSVTDHELLTELARASLIPDWPLEDDLSRALQTRPLLVEEALAADLPVIRTDPSTGRYVPHPTLLAALTAHLDQYPQERQAAHARLAAHNASTDPVLAVRHACLANDTDRAIRIATQWLERIDPEATQFADPLLLELVPFERDLPGRLRLRVADVLAQAGRNAEAIQILHAVRTQRPGPGGSDDADPEDVALHLARVYATTGAYDHAYRELRAAAEQSTRPFLKAFAALLLVRMHARGSNEFPNGESVLDVAGRWSEGVLKHLRRSEDARAAHADTELMALVVHLYLNHWAERSVMRVKLRLELLILQNEFQTVEAGDALLLLHRLMTDHGHPDLAGAALNAARRLLHLRVDARAALHAADGCTAQRAGNLEDAVGSFLLARDALNPGAPDRALDAEMTQMVLCALLCIPTTPLPELWQAQTAYAQAAVYCRTPQHAATARALTDLCRLRDAQAGLGSEKMSTVLQRLRAQLPTLIMLRCEAAPLVLLTVAPTESGDRVLHMERTWQVQEMVRSIGAAAVHCYRQVIAPDFKVLRSHDLRVHLIGTPMVELDGQELRLTPQEAMLVAFLAVHRGYVTIDHIATVLFDGGVGAAHTALSRFRTALRKRDLEGFLGQASGLGGGTTRQNQYTIRHHRITLDLDQYGNHSAEAFWRALGPRGLANLMSGHDSWWADQLRAEWAQRCPAPVPGA